VDQAGDPPRGDAYIYALSDEAAYRHIDEDKKPEIVMEPPDHSWFTCSFCRRSDRLRFFGAEYPVRNPDTFAVITHICICGACVAKFAQQLAQEASPETPPEAA
jgi:hypothetical protein